MSKQVVEIVVAGFVFVLSALGLQTGMTYAGRASDMPVAVMGLSLLLSLVWIGQSVLALARHQAMPIRPDRSEVWRLASLVALSLVYVAGIAWVGFFTCTAIFIPLASAVLGLRKPLAIAVATLGFLVILYGVFGLLLKTPLPPEAIMQWVGPA